MTVIADATILAGIAFLCISFIPLRVLINHLPSGGTRKSWTFLVGLIAFFIVGYVAYAASRWQDHETVADLLVPGVFFLGAIFILLVSYLSLRTALSLQRIALLEQESITDPLTGMFNRRHLDRRLEREAERARRYAYPLSILLIDIDHFKKINDEHGHQLGDFVLKNLAQILFESVRRTDIVARYGGEEIMIVTPHAGEVEALDMAERIRILVQEAEVAYVRSKSGRQSIRITISIGVATLDENTASTNALIELADTALYQAKNEGRNRVIQALRGAKPSKR
jgi:diguanylate cyclase (GGDEF)-like protein